MNGKFGTQRVEKRENLIPMITYFSKGDSESVVITDGARAYSTIKTKFCLPHVTHHTVVHKNEFVNEKGIRSNLAK